MVTGERRNPILAVDGYARHLMQDDSSFMTVKSVRGKQVVSTTSHQK
jgi:hypothetical protein